MTRAILLLALLGCTKTESYDDLELAPPAPAVAVAPPPPPPPPPPAPQPAPPPPSIATFLATDSTDPWAITIDRRRLSPDETRELVERLASETSYTTGDIGCVVERSTRVTLARGTRRLTFGVNCGHVEVDGNSHAAIFSSSMLAFFRELEQR